MENSTLSTLVLLLPQWVLPVLGSWFYHQKLFLPVTLPLLSLPGDDPHGQFSIVQAEVTSQQCRHLQTEHQTLLFLNTILVAQHVTWSRHSILGGYFSFLKSSPIQRKLNPSYFLLEENHLLIALPWMFRSSW